MSRGRVLLALAGDTMLGRGVGDELRTRPPESLVSDEVAEVCRAADLTVLNLECCISDRGDRWPDPDKWFFFRAPPAAVDTLVHLGVDCVTLANNHALDFGRTALADTFEHLRAAGIPWVGAGLDVDAARAPYVLRSGDFGLRVVGVTDHPSDFAASQTASGTAYADLRRSTPAWLLDAARPGPDADAVLVMPHWGPNMTSEPVRHVRRTAGELVAAGATLVAGHSAHVFHGVCGGVLYDLGDFLDDYATDPVLRNDLGLLWLVTLDVRGPVRIEALPLKLEFCFTRLARDEDASWIHTRLDAACAAFGAAVTRRDGRLVVEPDAGDSSP